MKKVSLLLISLVVFISLTGCNTKKNTEKPKIEDQVQNGTQQRQGDFLVTNLKIKAVGTQSVVSGKVKNTAKKEKSITVTLQLTNSDKAQLLGEVNIPIESIAPGETKDFSLSIVGDYTTVNNFEVKVTENN